MIYKRNAGAPFNAAKQYTVLLLSTTVGRASGKAIEGSGSDDDQRPEIRPNNSIDIKYMAEIAVVALLCSAVVIFVCTLIVRCVEECIQQPETNTDTLTLVTLVHNNDTLIDKLIEEGVSLDTARFLAEQNHITDDEFRAALITDGIPADIADALTKNRNATFKWTSDKQKEEQAQKDIIRQPSHYYPPN